MSEKVKKIYLVFMSLLTVTMIGIFVYCIISTRQYNSILRSANTEGGECTFELAPRNGDETSWTHDGNLNGREVKMYACTYDGEIKYNSKILLSSWTLRIDIESDCYINQAWCGNVEIHQNDSVQTLDLRNPDDYDITLDYIIDGDLTLIPLSAGDYLIYYPSESANEFPLAISQKYPSEAIMGVIFYWEEGAENPHFSSSVEYLNKKSVFQGKAATAGIVLLILWVLMLESSITTYIAAKVTKSRTELKMTTELNKTLNTEVEKRTQKIAEIQRKIVLGLAEIIENRDSNTGGHVKRTSDVTAIIIDELKKYNNSAISMEKANDIVQAAPMHDLGKITIPDSILTKPGRLTDEEFAIMKTHSAKSGEIVIQMLEGVEEEHFLETAYNIARHHHERWDGKGYPDGIAGTDIPIEARVMAIADVYDALVSKRCYKEPMSFEQAAQIMCENMGSQFDPMMKDIFLSCRQKLEEYYKLAENI